MNQLDALLSKHFGSASGFENYVRNLMKKFQHIDEHSPLYPTHAPEYEIGNVLIPKSEMALKSMSPRPREYGPGVVVLREWNREFKDWRYTIEWRPDGTEIKLFQYEIGSLLKLWKP